MKFKITISNKSHIIDDVFVLLKNHAVQLLGFESGSNLVYIKTNEIENSLARTIATKIMALEPVSWVETVARFPSEKNTNLVESLVASLNKPLALINNKGKVLFKNPAFEKAFDFRVEHIKDVFSDQSWVSCFDSSVSTKKTVLVKTKIGDMLIKVNPVKGSNETTGASLEFSNTNDVKHSYHQVGQSNFLSVQQTLLAQPSLNDEIQKGVRLIASHLPLVVYGEPGLNKKSLVQTMHMESQFKSGPFIPVNCQQTPANELRPLLFGGGKTSENQGLLALAKKGTLYLESVHLMPLPCQKAFSEFLKSSHETQVVINSSKEIEDYVKSNSLHKELYYQINLASISIPPLNARKTDIEPLTRHFINDYCTKNGFQNIDVNPDAISKLENYHWPKNISQLEGVLFNAVMNCEGYQILEKDIELSAPSTATERLESDSLPKAVNDFEKKFLLHWYKKHQSTRILAKHLGVSHTTIAQKLKKHAITK